MKKLLLALLITAVSLLSLAGCEVNAREILLIGDNAKTELEGVYLTLFNVETKGGCKTLNTVWHNESDNSVTLSNHFKIEYRDGEEWVDVTDRNSEVTEIAYILEPYTTLPKSYTTKGADLSRDGVYRLSAKFTRQSGCELFDFVTYVEFEVKDSGDVRRYSLTSTDNSYLFEKLNKSYKEGERVTVKTHIFMDLSLSVYANGRSLGPCHAVEENGRYTHWEYYFIMPSEDVTLSFKCEDGFLAETGGLNAGSVYAGYGAPEEFYLGAINGVKLTDAEGSHLPVYMIESEDELSGFKAAFTGDDDYYPFSYSYDERPSFDEATSGYNAAFYESYSLIIIYVTSPSGSLRFGIDGISRSDTDMMIYVKQLNNPPVQTDDMAGWFIMLIQPKEELRGISYIDAAFPAVAG